jgi:DNA mismatch repair ATPase MutS
MPPSRAIARLHRLADMLDWQRNAFFAPIGATFSWPLHIAALMGRWRRDFGSRVPAWLDTLGEYEALNSLAAYAFEHPQDPFPLFLEDSPSATFDGKQIGHPLVPVAQMVRNDVRLTREVRLLIISGSNMSGKSTLLRTVGINVVMAMAGGPVRAERLELTPLAVGATLHIQDSLQAGRSRFFTEITRVRQIADLAGRQPRLLFLLDELFQGTNSHDRKVGATAVLRSLVDRGAIGLITTHDLALTAIANELVGRALNVHFQDEFRGDEMVFDYKMRPGPVAHSNALALMRAVGLSVADDHLAADTNGHE